MTDTPKNLSQAISNGITAFNENSSMESTRELVECVRLSVEEFMRNKLSLITGVSEDPKVEKSVIRILDSLK
ncbi:MAG: hypothetical protein HC883_00320 [Bdellovibrionaceae bacterium]|nr:hypothetical protein [Pseudobdellovibrionaceae bacterium]